MICMLSQQALALKGKCLRLGIDYCRQDLGKTVIVRDVFYNQPVRRKQMHSNYRHWDLLRWTTMLYLLLNDLVSHKMDWC
ncbi:DNA mismatch repair protein MLH3-like isoform X2 [Solanum dulcamara]|uniref:DNA mismatch repair protein MLH3-like isoform X2 n=1 Tax=Solanum dulcamara TaxID=45834 RepID=UPI002485DA5B|nr:DNA mismatch repair protein MLH3-like isoform X2 [Solanum dulcamara]